MERDVVAGEWAFRGLRDLLFAFSINPREFFVYSTLHNITGLEKLLKAGLLYCRPEIYSCDSEDEDLKAIDKQAKAWGHGFERMLRELSLSANVWDIDTLLSSKFDSRTGAELLGILNPGFFETRYPTTTSCCSGFSSAVPDAYHDALNSTCTRDFIYALSREVLVGIKRLGGVQGLNSRVMQSLLPTDLGQRFNRIFFSGRIDDYL